MLMDRSGAPRGLRAWLEAIEYPACNGCTWNDHDVTLRNFDMRVCVYVRTRIMVRRVRGYSFCVCRCGDNVAINTLSN